MKKRDASVRSVVSPVGFPTKEWKIPKHVLHIVEEPKKRAALKITGSIAINTWGEQGLMILDWKDIRQDIVAVWWAILTA